MPIVKVIFGIFWKNAKILDCEEERKRRRLEIANAEMTKRFREQVANDNLYGFIHLSQKWRSRTWSLLFLHF